LLRANLDVQCGGRRDLPTGIFDTASHVIYRSASWKVGHVHDHGHSLIEHTEFADGDGADQTPSGITDSSSTNNSVADIDTDGFTADVSVSVAASAVGISASPPTNYIPGNALTFTVTITNNSTTIDLTGIQLDDVLSSAAGSITAAVGTVRQP